MFHRSERLLLRPIWSEDWQGIKAGIADRDIVRNLASAPYPYKDEDARKFASLSVPALYPRFLITLADNGVIIGCIGLDPCEESDGEVGYWIARDHWGRGYATEAGKAVTHVANMIGYRRLTAAHFTDNPASGNVLRKIGFTPTGVEKMQHSLGRGGEAMTLEYELVL